MSHLIYQFISSNDTEKLINLSELVSNNMAYYLAVISPGHLQNPKQNPLFKEFEDSLPPGAKKFESDREGFVGSLAYADSNLIFRNRRSFVLYDLEDGLEGIDSRFFLNIESAILEIPDMLKVIVDYSSDVHRGRGMSFEISGSIDEMLKSYNESIEKSLKELLLERLSHPRFKEIFTRKRWFGFGKRKMIPTTVKIGIETPTIETTGEAYCIGITWKHPLKYVMELEE